MIDLDRPVIHHLHYQISLIGHDIKFYVDDVLGCALKTQEKSVAVIAPGSSPPITFSTNWRLSRY